MSSLVLNTSALVALQRHRPRLLAFLERMSEHGLTVRVPAPTLTEFLGGSPRALRPAADHLTSYFEVGTVDEALARRAAALQRIAMDGGAPNLPGPIDALGAATAEGLAATLIFDGDREDFEALADASGEVQIKALRELE